MTQAELNKLEHAFAADPTSEAYRPLAEAYLSMGRFVEALVVCKKGVKAHPNVPEPRLLLARVYADQGKDKKALEELQACLQLAPQDKAVLRLAGDLQMKQGEAEAGKSLLIQAFQVDPSDVDTQGLLKKWNVTVAQSPTASSTRPPKAPPPPPVEALATQRSNGITAAPTLKRPAAENESAPPTVRSEAPSKPAAPRRAPTESEWAAGESPVAASAKPKGRGKSLFLSMLVIGFVGVGTYAVWGIRRANQSGELRKFEAEAIKSIRNDTAESYAKAIESSQKALQVDSKNTKAHAMLAFAYAVLWGEHGGEPSFKELAERHLKSSMSTDVRSPYSLAAEALLLSFDGRADEALRSLIQKVGGLGEQGNKAIVFQTMGQLRLNMGDFEGAKDDFTAALNLSTQDPRTHASLGTLYLRRGQEVDALGAYQKALSYNSSHPDSALGFTYALLTRENPDKAYVNAAAQLKAIIEAPLRPARRHMGVAYMLKSLLIARVGRDLESYVDKEFVKELSKATGVTTDREKTNREITAAEQQALKEDRDNPELHFILGRREYFAGNFDGAAEAFRKAIEMDKTRAHYHVELARALVKKEDGAKEAENALRTALKSMPTSPKLRVMLGKVLERQNKTAEALAEYELATQDVKSKNPEARVAMGRLLREGSKDYDKSLAQLEKAYDEADGQGFLVARVKAELGLTLEAKGNAKAAREAYEAALNLDENFADPYFLLARIIAADANEKTRAKALASKYLELSSDGRYAKAARNLL